MLRSLQLLILLVTSFLLTLSSYGQDTLIVPKYPPDIKWDTLSDQWKQNKRNYEVEDQLLDYKQKNDSVSSMDFVIKLKIYLRHPEGSRRLLYERVKTINDSGNAAKMTPFLKLNNSNL